MSVWQLVRCDLVTGREDLITLPAPTSIEKALGWARDSQDQRYRYWPDLPAYVEDNKYTIREDYFFYQLGKEEARSILMLYHNQKAVGQVLYKLKTKNLVDGRGRLTVQGTRVAEKLLCNQLQKLK